MAKTKSFGLKAILELYNIRLLLKGTKYPIIVTILIVGFFLVFGEVDKEILASLVNLILSIIPSLLGFVLSGYALLIGFGNIEIIAKKPKSLNEDSIYKPTLYQKVSTVFAIGLIMQVFLLVLTFSLKMLLEINLPCLIENTCICDLVNYSLFTLLVFCLLYVTIMIKDLVVTIFNFSQVQHLFINKPPTTNGN